MRAQSERFGTQIVTETVAKLDLSSRPFKFTTEWSDEVHTADSVIIATGASARRLGLPGEDKYWQNGISACAVCDGAVPIFSVAVCARGSTTTTKNSIGSMAYNTNNECRLT